MKRITALSVLALVKGQSVPPGSGNGAPIVAPKTKKHDTEGGIKKVVTLLNEMKKTIAADMERDAGLYDKFACYCKEEKETVGTRIEDNKALLVKLTKSINLASSLITEAKLQIAYETANIARENKKQKNLSAVLDKDKSNFAKRRAENTETLNVLSKAIGALTKKKGSFLEMDSEAKKSIALVAQLTGKSVGEGSMGAATGYLVEMKKSTAADLQQQTKDILMSTANHNKETLISMQAIAQHEEIKSTQEGILAKNLEKKGSDVKEYNAAKKILDADVKFFDTLSADCDKRSRFYAGQVRDANSESDAIDAALPILQSIVDDSEPAVEFVQLGSRITSKMTLNSRVDATSRAISKLSTNLKTRVLAVLNSKESSSISKLVTTCETMITTLKGEIKEVETNKATCISETQRLTEEKIDASKQKQAADDTLAATVAAIEHKTFEVNDCEGKLERNVKKTQDLIAQCTATATTLGDQGTELKSEIAAINQAIGKLQEVYGDSAIGSQIESERYTDAGISRKEGQPGTDFSDTEDRRSGGGSIVQMLTMIRDQVAKNIGDTAQEAAESAAACGTEKTELLDTNTSLNSLLTALKGEKRNLKSQEDLDDADVIRSEGEEDNAQNALMGYGNCAQKIPEYNNSISAKYADIDGLTLVISHLSNIDADYATKAGTE